MSQQNKLIIATLLVLAPLLMGYVFPEQLWGMHFLCFLVDWQAALFMLIGAVGLWVASSEMEFDSGGKFSNMDDGVWNRLQLSLSLLAGAFVISTPLVADVYGDSFSIIPHFSETIGNWTPEMTSELLSFDLTNPKIGEQTLYSVSFILSYVFSTTPLIALKYLEVFCFVLSMFFWGYLIKFSTKNLGLRTVLLLAGILAPFAFVYHAHTEMYALPFTFILGYLALSKYTIESKSQPTLIIVLWVLLILGMKFHVFCALLAPIPLMMTIDKSGLFEKYKQHVHWIFLVVGMFAVGITYVFVADSVNGTRVFSEYNLYDAVFLPLVPLEGPPLDRYNLFSVSHITDYVNMVYLWGTGLWILLFVAGRKLFSRLNESSFTKGLFLSFSAFAMVFFILNPLLGMSADMDLYFFPGLLLMPLLLESLVSIESSSHSKLALVLLPLTLLNIPLLAVHLDKEQLSERLTVVGRHEFKTYWKGSSSTIKMANELQPVGNRTEHLSNTLQLLEPFAVKGLDNEFAELLRTLASEIQVDEPERKLQLLEKAYVYSPFLLINTYELAQEYSRLGEFVKARPLVFELVKNSFPNKRRSIQMAVYVHLMLGEKELAMELCQIAITEWTTEKGWKELFYASEAMDIKRAIDIIKSL